MSQGIDILNEFIRKWTESFKPLKLTNKKWNWEWSCYMSEWLWRNYECWFEYPVNPEVNRHKLDAAIWLTKKGEQDSMDLALEWEWDHDKVLKKFSCGDFVKVISVPAKAGLAIIHTRLVKDSIKKAENTLKKIKESYIKNRKDNRPVGVIEIRQILKVANAREFECLLHNISDDSEPEKIKTLNYSW